jgi:hypothetical protein
MNKTDLARRLARTSRKSQARAADNLDRLVCGILARVRRGESASLPGLGVFRLSHGRWIGFQSEGSGASKRKPAGSPPNLPL